MPAIARPLLKYSLKWTTNIPTKDDPIMDCCTVKIKLHGLTHTQVNILEDFLLSQNWMTKAETKYVR